MTDAELLEGAPDLRLAGLGRVEITAASVGIELIEQPLPSVGVELIETAPAHR
jgi:hypothetical protein